MNNKIAKTVAIVTVVIVAVVVVVAIVIAVVATVAIGNKRQAVAIVAISLLSCFWSILLFPPASQFCCC